MKKTESTGAFSKFHKMYQEQLKKAQKLDVDYSKHFDTPPPIKYKPKIIVDTDIASDLDDALAVLLLLHIPTELFDLLGIVTVYGWVELRKSVTEAIVRSMEDKYFQKVPIIAGVSTPMSGKEVWHTECEGEYILEPIKIKELIDQSQDKYLSRRKPIEWYANTLKNLKPGEKAVIISIGALTNLAQLYLYYPEIAKEKIERLVIMVGGLCKYPSHELAKETGIDLDLTKKEHKNMVQGEVYSHAACHNVKCDIKATHIVISKATEWKQIIQFVTTEVTHNLWFDGDGMLNLLKAKSPKETEVVARMSKSWLDYRTNIIGYPITGTCPHDAVAIIEAICPGLTCKYKRGWFYFHEKYGYTIFVPDPLEGPHYGTAVIDGKKFLDFLGEGMVRQLTISDVMKYNPERYSI